MRSKSSSIRSVRTTRTERGGYTRVLGLARTRLGDNAPRAYFGYVREDEAVEAAPEEAAASSEE